MKIKGVLKVIIKTNKTNNDNLIDVQVMNAYQLVCVHYKVILKTEVINRFMSYDQCMFSVDSGY